MKNYLVNRYQVKTKSVDPTFKNILVANLLSKTNIFVTQITGAALVAVALLLGDDGLGAFQKFLTWQAFIVGLCVIFARSRRFFSFFKLEQAFDNVWDRAALAGMNFILAWPWAQSFLNPNFGFVVCIVYGIISYFLFAPNAKSQQESSLPLPPAQG